VTTASAERDFIMPDIILKGEDPATNVMLLSSVLLYRHMSLRQSSVIVTPCVIVTDCVSMTSSVLLMISSGVQCAL